MMESILKTYAEQPSDPAALVADLVAQIRPERLSQIDHAAQTIEALCHVLDHDPEKAQLLRDVILSLLGERKPISLYVDSGIQPSSGFFTEMWRRFSHKILPDAIDPTCLKDVFSQIFSTPTDEIWVKAVPDEVWLQLLHALRFERSPEELSTSCHQGLLDATQVLSYRLSASGLEPELIRNYPELEDHASPFIMQNIELGEFLRNPAGEKQDINHILVMLDQCRQVILKVRRNSSQTGTSIRQTFLLQRMSQQIARLEHLLGLVMNLRSGESVDADCIRLFKMLVSAESHKNNVGQHWRENMELLALRVTENASRTGEHYITETRSEYFWLMRSAMGAGAIIAIMAMIKIFTAAKHLPPLTEAILISLNYGIGFMLIHIQHFTVATKQPAMTAAAIAASIDASDGKTREMGKLVTIIAQTMRSQIVAILGNILLAVPVAMLIAWLIHLAFGQHFVTPEKAHYLLDEIDPVNSGSLFYAAIAGVCLFLSGLIAGYHDNLAVYNRIPQRIRALRWLQIIFGEPRVNRISHYIENNLGALAGNFYFGCLLGGMAAIGVLLGLPVDIRHIAFSSAFVGFSMVGLDFALTWQAVVGAALGVALIGAVNLLVSFSLALYVAMKSRKVNFAQWRRLVVTLARILVQQPAMFFLPPREDPPEDDKG